MTRRVWRIEHAEKRKGPWTAWGMGAACTALPGHMPTVHDEGLTVDPPDTYATGRVDWCCGHGSLRQLCSWWSASVLDALAEAGFVVSVYEVPAEAIDCGRAQVTFQRSQARRLEDHDPRNIHALVLYDERPPSAQLNLTFEEGS